MAEGKSGAITFEGKNGFAGQLLWTEYYDVTKNTSTLSITLQLKSTTYYGPVNNTYMSYYPNGEITIDDHEILTMNSLLGTHNVDFPSYNTWRDIKKSGGALAFPILCDPIEHNQDGSKSVTIGINLALATVDGSNGHGSTIAGKQTIELTEIPRGAVLLTAPSFSDEEPPTITYRNPMGSKVDSVQVRVVSLKSSNVLMDWTNIPKTSTSCTLTFTEAVLDKLWAENTTGDSFSVAISLRTKMGSSEYVSDSITCTATIVNSNPTLRVTATEESEPVKNLDLAANTWVRYMSKLKVDPNVILNKKATLESIVIKCGDQISTLESVLFVSVNSSTVDVTVTDSRNHTTTSILEGTLIPYVKLACNLEYVYLDTSGTLTVQTSGTCYNGDLGSKANELTVKVLYRVRGSSEWLESEPLSVTKAANSFNGQISLTELDSYETYEVMVQASDLFGTVQSAVKVVNSLPVFDWGKRDFNFNVPVYFSGGVPLINGVNIGTVSVSTDKPAELPIHGYCIYMVCAISTDGKYAIYSIVCDGFNIISSDRVSGTLELTITKSNGAVKIEYYNSVSGWYIVSGSIMPERPLPDPVPDPTPSTDVLKSSDGYTLTDSNKLYLTTKEAH